MVMQQIANLWAGVQFPQETPIKDKIMNTIFEFSKSAMKKCKKLRKHFCLESNADVLIKSMAALEILADAQKNNKRVFVVSEDGKTKQEIIT